MKYAVICGALMLCQQALAQVASYTYRLGELQVTEDAKNIVIAAANPLHIQILPGGHTWPKLALDEQGNLYVGDKVVASRGPAGLPSSAHGKPGEGVLAMPHGYRITALEQTFQVVRGTQGCTFSPRQLRLSNDKQPLDALRLSNIEFGASAHKLLALSAWLGAEKSDTRYTIVEIDLAKCRTRHTKLGNPDLLVELNFSSRGGWWVTGSIEQTLLHSKDGRRWRPVALPADLSSLVSAYIVDARHIWLAGILDSGDDDPLIVYSDNGGKSWKNITHTDPALAQLPRGWLEGWRRVRQPVEPVHSGVDPAAK